MSLGTLTNPRVAAVLDESYSGSRDSRVFLRLLPRIAFGALRGKRFSAMLQPSDLSGAALAVPRETGELLYLTARAIGARQVVEFGTSFGVSTIFLAAAVRDNGGGRVIGSEIEPDKCDRAQAALIRAGLDDLVEIRRGDARETLRTLPRGIDLLFLDGWKDLYLPILELVRPSLRQGAVVLADNMKTFPRDLAPYRQYVESPSGGFVSTVLPVGQGIAYSLFWPTQ